MFMGRDWKYWAMVAGFGALGMAWVVFQPEVYDVHSEVLMQQFHLPEDVAFEVLHSEHQGRYSSEEIVAIVQFTPGQYDGYIRSLDDSSLWAMQPFEWDDVEVEASAPSRALVWWDGNDAFHNGSSFPHWLDWGHEHGDAVWDVTPKHSFCFAVVGEGSAQSILQCGDLQEERPDVFVRGMIDAEGKRLFAFISQ
jgi:hypothetical protein